MSSLDTCPPRPARLPLHARPRIEYEPLGGAACAFGRRRPTSGRRLSVRQRSAPVSRRRDGDVDDVLLRIPAQTALRSTIVASRSARSPSTGTELRFPHARRDRSGEARPRASPTSSATRTGWLVSARATRRSRVVTLWVDESYPYLMVFTGDLPDVARRGLAVEPMTCPPNAFRSGTKLVDQLEPGVSWVGTWGIEPR